MNLFITLLTLISFNVSALDIGSTVEDFTLLSHENKKVSLSDFKGKTVVLEWFNHGCPFVRKHYDVNNMQMLQKKWKNKDVVWLTVSSSAKDKQGYLADAAIAKKRYMTEKMNA